MPVRQRDGSSPTRWLTTPGSRRPARGSLARAPANRIETRRERLANSAPVALSATLLEAERAT